MIARISRYFMDLMIGTIVPLAITAALVIVLASSLRSPAPDLTATYERVEASLAEQQAAEHQTGNNAAR